MGKMNEKEAQTNYMHIKYVRAEVTKYYRLGDLNNGN